jgi:aerobic carbon-monoxide dehydrogenase medium subunit
MIPGKFDYYAPSTLGEALALLDQYQDDAKLLAGGQSLIPAMRFRLSTPKVLIDLNGIEGLSYIQEPNGYLAIGAMTREVMVEESELVHQTYGMLADASHVIADPVVRNRSTVGGNLAHADPANDHPAIMLAYNAQVIAQGSKGSRTIPIDDFFVDLFKSALAPNEVLTEIRIPAAKTHSGGAYEKMERKVGDYAISAVAAQITLDGEICTAARIALTNVSPVPMRAKRAEQAIIGRALTDEVVDSASKAAAAECDPTSDLRGSVDYKKDLTRVLTKRAIRRAMERARGG